MSNPKKKVDVRIEKGYWNFLEREHLPVAVSLFSMVQLRGTVRYCGIYAFLLDLEGTGKQVLVFKHGIFSLEAMRPFGDVMGKLMAKTRREGKNAAKRQPAIKVRDSKRQRSQ